METEITNEMKKGLALYVKYNRPECTRRIECLQKDVKVYAEKMEKTKDKAFYAKKIKETKQAILKAQGAL
jgi:hypothetical protein